ncbi:NUDIX hydrolase [Terribacillus sp. DMT04]|uniref:NUDIX hydrolase n=1 Tax=Terribacillus sp. DMT04 TaxID=2850441 RepID=UPI001C2C1D19|nr:NUDIX domain-containing protein [Terribacillus sp. DMT04]QXE03043.1 NUDIX domain-containing protein [Terribacillus sp. DMT04]
MDYIKWIREKVGQERIFLNFAGGCIENEYGEILLQKRKDKEKWGFPGGAMDIGESVEETVIREVKEETGLDVKVDKLIGIYTKYFDEYPSGDKAQTVVFFFKLQAIDGSLNIEDDETLDLRFFSPDKIPPLVNKQHEDALKDYLSKQEIFIR